MSATSPSFFPPLLCEFPQCKLMVSVNLQSSMGKNGAVPGPEALLSRAAKRGGFERGVFPDLDIKCLALGPFCDSSIVRLFFFGEPRRAFDSVGEFTKVEGRKQSSAWCRGLIRS